MADGHPGKPPDPLQGRPKLALDNAASRPTPVALDRAVVRVAQACTEQLDYTAEP